MDKIKGLSPNHVCSKVKMAIFYAELILDGQIKGSFSKIMFMFKSQDSNILCRINLEWIKYRGVISWSGYMYQNIFHCKNIFHIIYRLKASDAYLNKKKIFWMKTNHYPNKITSYLATIIPMTSFTLKSTSNLRSFLHFSYSIVIPRFIPHACKVQF